MAPSTSARAEDARALSQPRAAQPAPADTSADYPEDFSRPVNMVALHQIRYKAFGDDDGSRIQRVAMPSPAGLFIRPSLPSASPHPRHRPLE